MAPFYWPPSRKASLSAQQAVLGRRTGRGRRCCHGKPSNSVASWAALRRTTPSAGEGQQNRPASSRFVARTRPVPSKTRSLTRSARLARKMRTSPANGSARSACCTVSVGWCSPCLGLGPFDRGLAMLDALLSRAVSSSPLPELHLFVRLWRRGDDPPEHLLELFHGHG